MPPSKNVETTSRGERGESGKREDEGVSWWWRAARFGTNSNNSCTLQQMEDKRGEHL